MSFFNPQIKMAFSEYQLLGKATYENYLDSYVTEKDFKYLRNPNICRLMVRYGLRSEHNIHSEKQFEIQKARLKEQYHPEAADRVCIGKQITTQDPVLLKLAEREAVNVRKLILTIIFLQMRNKAGFEVSALIDFEQSLRHFSLKLPNSRNWLGIFQDSVTLVPKSTDLSYVHWHTKNVSYNNTTNWVVVHDRKLGLGFMHRGDHQFIYIEEAKDCKRYRSSLNRTTCYSPKYGYVVLYDYVIRKKT